MPMLQVYANSTALVVSTENITQNWCVLIIACDAVPLMAGLCMIAA